MEAHDLHQHLVGIGRAIEGAGAGTMIGLGFGFQKLGATDLAFRIELANARLLVVGQARGHRTGRNEHGRQVSKGKRGNHQTRHDLVADAEIDGSVEHVVGKADTGRHGNRIAREQRQFHARLALRDAVAHCRNRTCHLCNAARFTGSFADDRRKCLIGLMRREHVVIGRDDAEVRNDVSGQRVLLGGGTDGKSMCQVPAGKNRPVRPLGDRPLQSVEIGLAMRFGSLDDPCRDRLNAGMRRHVKPPSGNPGLGEAKATGIACLVNVLPPDERQADDRCLRAPSRSRAAKPLW
ncbi:hypothetical protein D3C71_505170 [compost metagenome]